ncbi:MAG TPA: hypothetical protein VGI10_21085 [Polyangiaceae bacterium]|jgi:hypothetical protein
MATSHDLLVAVEAELARIGLLMQHDRELPSVTTLVAGEPIRGSWWGHARGRDIYELLTQFEHGAGALSLKLVNDKITYVHRALWPAFLTLSARAAESSQRTLSPHARALLQQVTAHGPTRLDELATAGFAPHKELTAAARELERALFLHADSVHTSSGAHAKVLQAWPAWAAVALPSAARPAESDARAEFEQAVARLTAGCRRTPRVPLLAH